MLKVFLMPQNLSSSEWISLLGDKYRTALPFEWRFVSQLKEANVLVWDGFMTQKGQRYWEEVVAFLQEGSCVLLLVEELSTLFEKKEGLSRVLLDGIKYETLTCTNVVPEDLLAALVRCRERLNHV